MKLDCVGNYSLVKPKTKEGLKNYLGDFIKDKDGKTL